MRQSHWIYSIILIVSFLYGLESSSNSKSSLEDSRNNSLKANEGSILHHHRALAEECAKYRQNSLEQARTLSQSHQSRHNPFGFATTRQGHFNRIQIPEICLFIEGLKVFGNHEKIPRRLEWTNWIEYRDQMGDKLSGIIHNISKRDTTSSIISKHELNQTVSFSDNANMMANQYGDISYEDSVNSVGMNPVLQNDIDRLTSDKRFIDAVQKSRNKLCKQLSPVILIPGLLGSRLQDKLNKTNKVNIFCRKQSDWQDGFWLAIRNFLPFVIDCWLDNARLEYDPSTGFAKSPPGVQVRAAQFGSVNSVKSLDPLLNEVTSYMSDLIDHYVSLGYTADENLFAAPYDFRLAPQQLDEYFEDLKELIETTQMKAGHGKRVTLVCHSMGCNHLLIFLRRQTKSWRQKRIRKVIALAAAWGGSFKALKGIIVGETQNLPLVSDAKIRDLVRSFPSISYLLPQPDIFAAPNRLHTEQGSALIETPTRRYYPNELEKLLKDLNLTIQFDWFVKSTNLLKPLEPLADVSLDCIHGLQVPTVKALIFRNDSDLPDGPYEIVNGDGDGTVNIESLMVCQQWALMHPDKIRHRIVSGAEHSEILSHWKTRKILTEDVLINS